MHSDTSHRVRSEGMLFAIEYEDENCYFKNLPARAIDVDAVNRQIPYRAFAGSLSSKKIRTWTGPCLSGHVGFSGTFNGCGPSFNS